MLHDPTTGWEELLKYHRSWVQLLVDEGTRRMARSASTGAQESLRRRGRWERRRTIAELEADYNDRRKQWKRRQRKRAKAGAVRKAPSGA